MAELRQFFPWEVAWFHWEPFGKKGLSPPVSLIGWVGVDGRLNGSFNFLFTLWVYRTCIGLLIYMFKNCHQLCYGFENSSYIVWISFSKLIWGNVFLKNHAKSKVFQNNLRPQTFFVKIWCQVGKLGYNSHRRTQSFRSFDQALTSPSGVQRRIYTTSAECEFTTSAEREFDGVDGRGIKSVLQISLYFVSI